MTIERMPAAEVDIDASIVRALLREQHPDLADLPVVEAGGGWDNRLFRLGHELLVRLPRRQASAGLIDIERRWLPELAPRLPLATPTALRYGLPGCGFPWNWTIAPWLPGRNAAQSPPDDLFAAATQLGAFVSAFHRPAPPDAPGNPFRGIQLSERSAGVQERMRKLRDEVDGDALLAVWEDAVRAPAWSGAPLWIHGDLHPCNLLVHDGRLSAVIDFGDLTAGDPATDLSVAWMLFPPAAHAVFRAASRETTAPVDDDTWRRARGWALALGLAYLAPSSDNADMAAIGRATLDAVLRDPF